MDANTLGRVYDSAQLLDLPLAKLQLPRVTLVTFGKVAADLRYVPKPFPGHRDFLDRHSFYDWAQWQSTRDPKDRSHSSPLATLTIKGVPKKRRRP